MRLNLTYQEVAQLIGSDIGEAEGRINFVSIDTRHLFKPEETLFFALKGEFRDGHDFILKAYDLGVRIFVVSEKPQIDLEDATYLVVSDVLYALQDLAKHHRSKFSYPVVGITGSAGKTSFKEIASTLLSSKFKVVKSPKSYNSQIGVALSLLELNSDAQIALIEAGISKPGEMDRLAEMIQPTIGVFTSLGTAHLNNFESKQALKSEKMKLFAHCKDLILHDSIVLDSRLNAKRVSSQDYALELEKLNFNGVMRENAALALALGQLFGLSRHEMTKQLSDFKSIALRLETFDGVANSVIINDTYNLDREALDASLQYQQAISKGRRRVLFVGTKNPDLKAMVRSSASYYEPIEVYFNDEKKAEELELENAVVLIKGERKERMETVAAKFRQFKHETYLEINLSSVRRNIQTLKSRIPNEVKILSMVKASSYGSGAEKLAQYLERIGVSYLGVAYPDEGAALRKVGVSLPIMVMNTNQSSYAFCIEHRLEPSIFSLDQLDDFIKELIYQNVSAYPVHIKLETGMNRLGFHSNEIDDLLAVLQAQPEIQVASIYSHLADSDTVGSQSVALQVSRFDQMSSKLINAIPNKTLRHILNSEGVVNFPQYHFDMVRLGIAMYGVTADRMLKQQLLPAISWYSSVSQIKNVKAGEGIGYNGKGTLKNDGQIAVVPVGYADGFRRSLGNGQAGVYIGKNYCPVVGNVCMDMIMVDVSGLGVKKGERVEIIGEHQTLQQLALRMETIPYEVLTGISSRVHRVYLED